MAKKRGGRYPEAPTAGRSVGILAWDVSGTRLSLTLTSPFPCKVPCSWHVLTVQGGTTTPTTITFLVE